MGQGQIHRSLLSGRNATETAGALGIGYVDAARLLPWLATSGAHPLAVISYGAPVPDRPGCPVLALDLPQLDARPMLEVWTSRTPVRSHHHAGLSVAVNGEILAGFLLVEEEPGISLDVTTAGAYRRLLREIRELGYPHLWRLWNYFPRINEERAGLERYRQFCVGRYDALADSLSDFPLSLPAATAVGTASGPLQIYFLAGVTSVAHLSNPRQVNAYDYPASYGPRSPSFARATLYRGDHGMQLFIAGTASVVGHASQHPGLPVEQTRETLNNLRALLRQAEPLSGGNIPGSPGVYKVYVRHPSQLAAIRRTLRDPLFESSRLLFLQGDLCRQELLVEIEGLVTSDC